MVLAAHEDKTYRGAFIASPTMPWAWGTGFELPKSGVYHAVWSRDLYQIVTGMMAAGDRGAAERALSFVFDKQQRPDGSIRQNTFVDGTPHWDGTQQDEVAFPIVLAWQLQPRRRADLRPARQAGGRLARRGPGPQTRHGPLGEPGRLVAGHDRFGDRRADLRRRPRAPERRRRERRAPTRRPPTTWQKSVESWTATTNGPYSDKPYYLRLTKDANPNDGSTYSIGDSGPSAADERTVVDPSFLELVRLGVKTPDDPTILNTIAVVDQQLAVDTPNGRFWHRANFDGYGEQLDGKPWDSFPAGHPRHAAGAHGRSSPASAASTTWPAGGTAERPAGRDGRRRQRGRPDPRAGVGRPAAVGHARLPQGRGHAVGDAAGVVARPVRAPGLVDRGGPPGRAAEHRRLPLRARSC